MRDVGLLQQIALGIIGIVWFGIIGWFVLSQDRSGILIFLIAGIFISLAFIFSSYMLYANRQAFGMPLMFSIVAIGTTVNEFNHEFSRNELVHSISMMAVLSALFLMAIVKIWDTLEYWEGGS